MSKKAPGVGTPKEAATGPEQPVAPPGRVDPNDEVDVPDVMYPAELDARGDAVNAMREAEGLPVPKTDDEDRGASYA